MKKLITLLLVVTSCLFANSTNKTLDVYKLATAPTVDGILTDWGSNWIDLANTDATSTTADCTSQFQIGYTSDSLYIAIKVQDATEFTYDATVASYFRDCVEAFIHMDTVTILGTNGSDQYRMQRVPDATVGFEPSTILANVISVNSSTGYNQEWAIAWTDIVSREPNFTFPADGIDALPIPYIRFDIKVADNTDGTVNGRTQQIFWNTTSDTEWPNMTDMGTLHLMGVTNGVSKVADNSTNVYYNASKDGLMVSNYIGEVRIYNVVGKLILQTKVNSNNELINLNSFNNGVYLVSGSGFSTKFIK